MNYTQRSAVRKFIDQTMILALTRVSFLVLQKNRDNDKAGRINRGPYKEPRESHEKPACLTYFREL